MIKICPFAYQWDSFWGLEAFSEVSSLVIVVSWISWKIFIECLKNGRFVRICISTKLLVRIRSRWYGMRIRSLAFNDLFFGSWHGGTGSRMKRTSIIGTDLSYGYGLWAKLGTKLSFRYLYSLSLLISRYRDCYVKVWVMAWFCTLAFKVTRYNPAETVVTVRNYHYILFVNCNE